MNAPLPPNEAARQRALDAHDILDTLPEPAFERIASMAARIFNAPIATVTLIDRDRQWFKACHGLDSRGSGRDVALCAHAILSDEVMVVPDATRDTRFTGNPLVTGPPGIRFYAGAPLKTREGFNVGTLCIIDTVPRQFGETERATLCDLAAVVVDELELRLATMRSQREIRERKQIEEALREVEARYERMAANTPGMVYQFLLHPNGAVEFPFVSAGCRELFGVEPHFVRENPDFLINIIHPEDRASFDASVTQSAAALLPWRWEGRFLVPGDETPNGGEKWIQGASRPELQANGDVIWDGVLVDVTERQRAQQATQQAREEAEQAQQEAENAQAEAEAANHAKSEFLSRMSHELRTPLNAILGFGQLLEMDALDDSGAESVEQIMRAGRHLLDLINEVLDISRIEAGRLDMSPEPVALSGLLREALDLVRPLAARGGITLHPAGADCDRHVLADRQRLKQVLLNLLSNAVKYNRDGGSVTVLCCDAPGDRIRLEISDTGTGIAPDKMQRLFLPFERLGAERGVVEGTGLGLALSKRLIEAMGGAIEVESTLGGGTTFSLILPLARNPFRLLGAEEENGADGNGADGNGADGSGADGKGAAAKHRCSVLYIEDNPSNLRLVERMLAQRPDVRLLTAVQGGSGLELAREHRPDLILLDLHLPDMAGDEVLARLRGDGATRDIPIAVLSADATPGRTERLREAGADIYLTKPLDVKKFLAVLEENLQPGETCPNPGKETVPDGAQRPAT